MRRYTQRHGSKGELVDEGWSRLLTFCEEVYGERWYSTPFFARNPELVSIIRDYADKQVWISTYDLGNGEYRYEFDKLPVEFTDLVGYDLALIGDIEYTFFRGRQRGKRLPEKGSSEWAMHKVAVDTVKNPDTALLGGPSLQEAIETLTEVFGYTEKEIETMQNYRTRAKVRVGDFSEGDTIKLKTGQTVYVITEPMDDGDTFFVSENNDPGEGFYIKLYEVSQVQGNNYEDDYRSRPRQRPENSLGTDMRFEGFTFVDSDFEFVVSKVFEAEAYDGGRRDMKKGEYVAVSQESGDEVIIVVNGIHEFWAVDKDTFNKSVKSRPSDSYLDEGDDYEDDYRTRPVQRHTNFSSREIEGILNSYTYAALWSCYDDEGDPLDYNFSQSDIAPRSIKQAEKDIQDFLAQAGDLVDFYSDDPSQIGHYFWLSRNHHGAGFFDDGQNELQRIAEGFREVDAVVGDDGMIYFE